MLKKGFIQNYIWCQRKGQRKYNLQHGSWWINKHFLSGPGGEWQFHQCDIIVLGLLTSQFRYYSTGNGEPMKCYQHGEIWSDQEFRKHMIQYGMEDRLETVRQVGNYFLKSVWSMHYRKIQFLIKHRHSPLHIHLHTTTYICKNHTAMFPGSPCPQKQYILGLIETGLSCSCLEQLGWFAGRDPKDCAVGHVAENPPVPSTLGLGGWWRSERSEFLPLDGRRWGCLNLWLLSYGGLNLLGRETKALKKQKKKKGKEKQISRKV